VLLDTHVLLRSLQQPERLSRTVLDIFRDAETRIVVSVAVLWEVAIKSAVAKFEASRNLRDELLAIGHEVLGIDARHAWRVRTLPMYHHDPFDRLLVAQAQIEDVPLITDDRMLERYDVRIIHA
jgi:PIN domain nuclease of toxin-antitoxin system